MPQTPTQAQHSTSGENPQLQISPWAVKGLDHTSSAPTCMAATQGNGYKLPSSED